MRSIKFIHNNQHYSVEIPDSLSVISFKNIIKEKTSIDVSKQTLYIDNQEIMDSDNFDEWISKPYEIIEMRQCFSKNIFYFQYQNKKQLFHFNDFIGQNNFIESVCESIDSTISNSILRKDLIYVYKNTILYDKSKGSENYLKSILYYIDNDSIIDIYYKEYPKNIDNYFTIQQYIGILYSPNTYEDMIESILKYQILDFSYCVLSELFLKQLYEYLNNNKCVSLKVIKFYHVQCNLNLLEEFKNVLNTNPQLVLMHPCFWNLYLRPETITFINKYYEKYSYKQFESKSISENLNSAVSIIKPKKKPSQKDMLIKIDIGKGEFGSEGMFFLSDFLQYRPEFYIKNSNMSEEVQNVDINMYMYLKDIEIYYNQIYTEGCLYLLSSIQSSLYNKLTVLNIGCNQVGDIGCNMLADYVLDGAFDHLKELQIYNNKLSYKGIHKLCYAFSLQENLTNVNDIDKIKFSPLIDDYLPSEEISLESLRSIDLLETSQKTTQETTHNQSLLNSINNRKNAKQKLLHCKDIEIFCCGLNPLKDEGAYELSYIFEMCGLPKLKEFQCYNNQIGSKGMKAICRAIYFSSLCGQNYTKLEHIELGGNEISDDGCLYISLLLYNNLLPNLKRLSLFNNSITDIGALYLLNGIKHQTIICLKDLRLYNNSISESTKQQYYEYLNTRSETLKLYFEDHKKFWIHK